jgi:hypothetical protein
LLLVTGAVVAACQQGTIPVVGAASRCFSIELDGWYGHPMTRDRGPYHERPAHYHGIPEIVQVRFSDGRPVEVRTVAPERVTEGWSVESRDRSVHMAWPEARITWALYFDLVLSGSDLVGSTWYGSHVLGLEPESIPTRWRQVRCPNRNEPIGREEIQRLERGRGQAAGTSPA